MIVVTGAAGQLGRQITVDLAKLVDSHRIGASVRDPAQVQDLADRGIRVRRGDFDDPASLAVAFEGADQVLIVSPNKLGDESALALNGTGHPRSEGRGCPTPSRSYRQSQDHCNKV